MKKKGIYGFFGLSWVLINMAPRNNKIALPSGYRPNALAGVPNDY